MIAVDSKGVAERISDTGVRWERPPSGKKVRANRRNGRKGKGPKTADGKNRSSRNAVQHGVLSSGREPIGQGPFAEDPNEHRQKIDLIVASLRPRDSIESRVAGEIGRIFVCADRLSVLETANFEGDARLTAEQQAHFESADDFGELEAQARGLFYHLAGMTHHPDPPYRQFANLMRYYGPEPGLTIKGRWDDDHQPSGDQDWERAFGYLLKRLWRSQTEAAGWANSLSDRFGREWLARQGREREVIAARSLEGTMDKVTKYRTRVMADLRRLLDLYSTLQARTLP